MTPETKMKEDFYDWLDKCPVEWFFDKIDFRKSLDKDYLIYGFEVTEEDKE